MNNHRPAVAIVDQNILSAMGLRHILQEVMPIMDIVSFGSFAELQANQPDRYVHYFVTMSVVLENRTFFTERRNKTIVLSPSLDHAQLAGFHTICTNVTEEQLVRAILALEQHAHGRGQHLPEMPAHANAMPLSSREVEVLSLIAKGLMNKEIADRLNIGLTTVISHRKNIQEKLGVKTVSALTIYAVMHGLVDINRI